MTPSKMSVASLGSNQNLSHYRCDALSTELQASKTRSEPDIYMSKVGVFKKLKKNVEKIGFYYLSQLQHTCIYYLKKDFPSCFKRCSYHLSRL